jgi:hypothetical protein
MKFTWLRVWPNGGSFELGNESYMTLILRPVEQSSVCAAQ